MSAPGKYSFPQQSPSISKESNERGIARMYHPDVGSLRFRANPNEFNWTYTINKRIDQTYGGRVVQLLGTKIDEFRFTADSGSGRWAYANKVAKFMRDVMVVQRNGKPATFEYTTRGWKLNCYVVSVPFQDSIEEVRREFEVTCKVQEDVSGIMSRNTLSAELRRLQSGMNYTRGKYNDPLYNTPTSDSEKGFLDVANAIGQVTSIVNQFGLNLDFLPNGVQGFNLGNLLSGG